MENTPPTLAELIRLRIVYSVAGMENVTVRRDLVYKTAADEALHMDIYSPPGAGERRPAVLLVHGGPVPRLGAKNMGVFVSHGELLAASGFVAATFNHRFLSPTRLHDAGSDVADAVTYVRDHAQELGVDADRLALWVFSGGGPFLAAPLRERPSWLRAAVAYYALLDLQQPPPGVEDGLSPELRRRYSALDGLGDDGRSAPALLVARAGLDHPWLNATLDRFVQAAVANGATLDLLTHPTGQHGFDTLDDNERSKEIIRRTVQFLRERLG